MPKHTRCAMGIATMIKRYPDLQQKRSHVDDLKFHKWPKDPQLSEIWHKQVAKSRSDDFNQTPGAQGTFICSNHFPLEKRTPSKPEMDYPSVFLTLTIIMPEAPQKRKINRLQGQSSTTRNPRRTFILPDTDSKDDSDQE